MLLLCCCCAAAAAAAAAVLLLSCCCAAAVVTYGYLFSVFLKKCCFAMPVDVLLLLSHTGTVGVSLQK